MSSPSVVTLVLIMVCVLVLEMEGANAATYTVGGPGGWTFNTDSWPKGKRFRAGDVLSE